jgi:hypothetical protein
LWALISTSFHARHYLYLVSESSARCSYKEAELPKHRVGAHLHLVQKPYEDS